MDKIPRAGNDLTFLHYVIKFVAAAKKYHLSLGRERIICPCSRWQNNLLHEDSVVKYHLIRYGFVENYIVWKFQGEMDPSVTSAFVRNSSTPSSVNGRGQQPSPSTATAAAIVRIAITSTLINFSKT